MERTHRLYDCITEVGDHYLQEAEAFQPAESKVISLNWKRWASLAAALLLVVGIGRFVPDLFRDGSSSEPAASAPAASAPAMEQSPTQAESEVNDGEYSYSITDRDLSVIDKEIIFTNGEVWAILSPEDAAPLDLPENLADAAVGEPVLWLDYKNGAFVPTSGPAEIALYAYTSDVNIITDGEHYYAAVLKEVP